MSDLEVINITRYSSDDVVAILRKMVPKKDWERVKIRYLITPKQHGVHGRWAMVTYRRYTGRINNSIEVALLKPENVKVSPLILLAQCSKQKRVAQPKIIADLCYAIRETQGLATLGKATTQALVDCGTLVINIVEKPTTRTRQLSAYRTFEDKVESAKATSIAAESALARARIRLEQVEDEIRTLEHKVPEKQYRWAKLQGQLVHRKLKLPKAIQDEIERADR